MKRPISFFNDIFPRLDVECRSSNGLLPLKIKGPLHPKNIEIDGSLSSQFLTGLLFAYAFAEASDVTIKVNNLNSKPYIDLTLQVLMNFGLKAPANNNYKEFYFPGQSIGKINHASFNYTVEGDWSGGAFLLVAGAIAGPITVRGLDLTSTQADRAIVDALMLANAGIAIEAKGIKLHPSVMNAFNFDATDCPDLFPPLVALAAYCKGKSIIKGVNRLAHKESDRALTLKEEFDKIGVKIELKNDEMIIYGGSEIKGTKVHSHHDHRIAMAMAVAALKANGETIIEEAQAVKKSFPDFYNDLKTLGVSVSLPYKLF